MAKVELPVTLPIQFVNNNPTMTLPITLPFSFSTGGEKQKKLELTEYYYEPVRYQNKVAKLEMKEYYWNFSGIVLEDHILGNFNSELTLIDEVRSKVLVNIDLIDRGHLQIGWYGSKVDKLNVLKKSFVDENYEKISTHRWEEGSTIIEIGDEGCQIKLEGIGGSGESSVIELEGNISVDVDADIDVSYNEKIYDIEINLVSKHKININL